MGLAKIYLYTKFECFSFTRFRFTEEGLKFNFWSLDHNHTIFEGILSCWTCQGLSYTEFDVSSFTRSRFTEWVIKLKKFDPGRKVICH